MNLPEERRGYSFPCLVAACLGVLLAFAPAHATVISEVEHANLPVFQKTVAFSHFLGPGWKELHRDGVLLKPGEWADVRIVAWKPPLATISGYRFNGKLFATACVHLVSFPPDLRPRVAEAASRAGPILAKSDDRDSLLLPGGTILRKYSITQATPEGVVISHASGVLEVPKSNLPAWFFKAYRVFGNFVYLRELTLLSGQKLQDVRLAVARDGEHCRISHNEGNRPAALADLPEDVRALVETHLVAHGRFAEEILTDPALLAARKRVAADPRPAPVPVPVPALERITPGHFAVLPLKDGGVLKNARVVSVGPYSVVIASDAGVRTVRHDDLPGEVQNEAGIPLMPLFSELIEHGVMSLGRSAVYELVSQNAADADFREAGKQASGGRLLARVGPGLLMTEGRWIGNGGGPAQFAKPLSGLTRGFVIEGEFAHLGPSSWRKWWLQGRKDPLAGVLDGKDRRYVFEPVDPSPETVLLNVCEEGSTLFGNRQGVIRRAWRIVPSARAGLAIAETESGLYLGILAEHGSLPESQMTWEQLRANRSGRHALDELSRKPMRENTLLFQVLSPANDVRASRLVFSPESARVVPGHYRILVEKGMTSLCALLDVPQGEGIELLRAGAAVGYGREKETEIEKIGVYFLAVSPSSVTLKVTVQQRERDVERERNPDGRVTVSRGAWKTRKIERVNELERDGDGGLRVTDGKVLYELAFPKVGGFHLATFEVKENVLNRSPL